MEQEYKTTPQTARFIYAMKMFEDFKERYYEALTCFYGEDMGDDLFNKDVEVFDNVQRIVGERMVACVVDRLNRTDLNGLI